MPTMTRNHHLVFVLSTLSAATASADPTAAAFVPTTEAAPLPPSAAAPSAPTAEATAQADVLAQHPWSVSVVAGSSIPINGLNYNEGIGVRGGIHVATNKLKHVYLGGILAVHAGDSKTIGWGPTQFSNGGDQHYNSHPLFVAADAGYSFQIPVGTLDTVLTPCLSAGVMVIGMDTDGVYGTTSITNTYGVVGFAASWDVNFNSRFYAGAHYRLYNTGDTSFSFGDLAQGTYQHGFSTSVFYYALYSELGYRF
jgi:hypothetical protein